MKEDRKATIRDSNVCNIIVEDDMFKSAQAKLRSISRRKIL